MRFLVTSTPKFPPPPDALPMLVSAMRDWAKRHQSSNKIEQIWGFVTGGGGGIMNVASHEELNAIIAEMPFGPFADTDVRPIIALEVGLNNFAEAMKRMTAPKP